MRKIRAAQGEAEAIIKIQEATAQGLKLLKDANMDEAVLKYKSYETMVDVANGNATKIIVPSELQNFATIGTTIAETLDSKTPVNTTKKSVKKIENLESK